MTEVSLYGTLDEILNSYEAKMDLVPLISCFLNHFQRSLDECELGLCYCMFAFAISGVEYCSGTMAVREWLPSTGHVVRSSR